MKHARKAIAAAATPVVLSLVSWAVTGELNTQEFSIALAGLVAAVVVYAIPNAPAERRARNFGRSR